ncbi:PEP-CTERM sorting domain-containing protein [Thiobacillus sp.]
MKRLKQFVGYLLLGIGLSSAQSYASIIQSMTIEEIGIASGGLGSSALFNGAGEFAINAPLGFGPPSTFSSSGSTDGAIVMGAPQAKGTFTPGFMFFGYPASVNTLNRAPSGLINGSNLTLDMSGWEANWIGQDFAMFPDGGTFLASALFIDPNHYFYTADWTHLITATENSSFAGVVARWHLEGIATVPEPGTFWLLGVSALGLMVSRRRKHA